MLKASRAADMAEATASMRLISKSYQRILKDLDALRQKELIADQIIARYPEKTEEVTKKMDHAYILMDNKLAKFLASEQ